MASGAGLNQGVDNPISPEKSLLSRYERTAPPRNPRAPTPIDPKEEEARKAVETIPVKAVAFKDQNSGQNPRNFGHLPPQWTKFIPPAGFTKKTKEVGVADLLKC